MPEFFIPFFSVKFTLLSVLTLEGSLIPGSAGSTDGFVLTTSTCIITICIDNRRIIFQIGSFAVTNTSCFILYKACIARMLTLVINTPGFSVVTFVMFNTSEVLFVVKERLIMVAWRSHYTLLFKPMLSSSPTFGFCCDPLGSQKVGFRKQCSTMLSDHQYFL